MCLNNQEEQKFQEEIDKLESPEQKAVMEFVTSWGVRAERSLVLRLLNRKVGQLPDVVQEQVEFLPFEQLEALAEDLLDFTSLADLKNWLALNHG